MQGGAEEKWGSGMSALAFDIGIKVKRTQRYKLPVIEINKNQ